MKTFAQGTIDIARATEWAAKVDEEISRLLRSGAVDPTGHNRALLIGVALENIADNYMRDMRKTKEYRNIKRF